MLKKTYFISAAIDGEGLQTNKSKCFLCDVCWFIVCSSLKIKVFNLNDHVKAFFLISDAWPVILGCFLAGAGISFFLLLLYGKAL